MPQPTPYDRAFSFTDYQAANPSNPVPGYRLDAELDHLSDTLTGVLGNLALIQRDDGKLANGCVTVDAIDATLFAAIAAAAPPGPKGDPGVGIPGNPGANAPNPNFTLVANTLAPGAAATIAVSGAYPNLTLTFGIPQGAPAPAGAAVLANGVYGDVTVSAGGTVLTVNKVAGVVPSFPGHAHAIADVTGLTAALAAKQAAGSYAPTGHAHSLAELASWGLIAGDADAFGALVFTDATGIATLGKAIDFHVSDNDGTDFLTRLQIIPFAGGSAMEFLGNALFVGGSQVSVDGHTHAIADVTGLAAALAGKQAAGSYATTAQLATKADAVTPIFGFASDQVVSDAVNGGYCRLTGATTRTLTFGSAPTAGHCSIWVNRGTVPMTVVCAGGYYKNGAAAPATANLSLAPGGKLTAFHEGAGVWTFDGSGF